MVRTAAAGDRTAEATMARTAAAGDRTAAAGDRTAEAAMVRTAVATRVRTAVATRVRTAVQGDKPLYMVDFCAVLDDGSWLRNHPAEAREGCTGMFIRVRRCGDGVQSVAEVCVHDRIPPIGRYLPHRRAYIIELVANTGNRRTQSRRWPVHHVLVD